MRTASGLGRWRRPLGFAVLVATLATTSAHADGLSYRAPPSLGRQAYDLAVLRPLGFVQTVVGVSFFAAFYPISLLTGSSNDVVRICITGPVEQTFRRPLGEL